ncbi:MAG: glycosyltransferase involved in cell wall biosynthesis [Salinirussus sp.]|jgi:glycosyltransferase involved in cell wall biosynthesis
MRVSVVVCEHTLDRYDDLREAAGSVLTQTHDDVELVLVADGDEDVCTRLRQDYADYPAVRVHCNEANVGLLESRNNGAKAATGDVVAFLDDDAVADEEWVAELVAVYEQRDVPAVGGRMTPAWVAGKPGFLPAEFYWLVGVTHRGFAEGPGEVRNTFGSNISFRRACFLELGGFDTEIGGRQGDANLQGGETELCARLAAEYGHGVYYTPDAEVAHKVFDYRTEPAWLLDRAFWQGYSKRGMEVLVPESGSTDAEADFLDTLLLESAPDRLRGLVAAPSIERGLQFAMLWVLTAAVGLGYLYGAVKWGVSGGQRQGF